MYAIGFIVMNGADVDAARSKLLELDEKLSLVQVREQDIDPTRPTNDVVDEYAKLAESATEIKVEYFIICGALLAKEDLKKFWGATVEDAAPKFHARYKYLGDKFKGYVRVQLAQILARWAKEKGAERLFVADKDTRVKPKIESEFVSVQGVG
jgi:hypothetical protein